MEKRSRERHVDKVQWEEDKSSNARQSWMESGDEWSVAYAPLGSIGVSCHCR